MPLPENLRRGPPGGLGCYVAEKNRKAEEAEYLKSINDTPKKSFRDWKAAK